MTYRNHKTSSATGEAAATATKPMDEPIRSLMLQDGLRLTLGDRNAVYGDPTDNLNYTSQVFEAMTGIKLAPSECALFMVAAKLARLRVSPDHWDSAVDALTYTAIYGEVRRMEEARGYVYRGGPDVAPPRG